MEIFAVATKTTPSHVICEIAAENIAEADKAAREVGINLFQDMIVWRLKDFTFTPLTDELGQWVEAGGYTPFHF